MAQAIGKEHQSVLLTAALEGLQIVPDGFYIDGTYGRGGHSKEILKHLGPHGRLLAFDKDPQACVHAHKQLSDDSRFEIRHGSFTRIVELQESGMMARLAGVFFDLGVSSPQLENAERGFSFLHDGPLDMRMDNTVGISAADWLSSASEKEIARVLREYGEERQAKKIANAIFNGSTPRTTLDLANLVASVLGYRFNSKHPATRTFLAIRLYINRELEELREVLATAVTLLRQGGRLVVISFHSLEDRIVKNFIRDHSVPQYSEITGQALPGTKAVLRKVGKKMRASADEINNNPRARSALLRVAEKI